MEDRDPFPDATTALGTRFNPTKLAPHDFCVVIDEGIDAGLRYALAASAPSSTLIGQSSACAVRLRDHRVSRRHVTLDVQGAGVRILDQGSTNGTLVQGVSIHDAVLFGGERVVIGDTVFHVELLDATCPEEPPLLTHFGRMIGASFEMRRIYPLCAKLAASSVPVVIEGETGTGKEALAEALHEQSPRAQKPFVVFDCTAVAPSLAESELFGHERGAFTGAAGMRRGVFEQADGGTLFIDEIGDLDLSLQPKLLRAVERGEIRRVGSETSRKVDIRIIAATRRNLDQAVANNRFRDDLFHRLMVGRVELPPLRERRSDVAILARHFWQELGGTGPLPERLLAAWEADPWPGNVRALRNAVSRHLALGETADLIPPSPASSTSANDGDLVDEILARDLPLPRARQLIVEQLERRYIARLLDRHGGDTASAAAASGIARRYFNLLRARHR